MVKRQYLERLNLLMFCDGGIFVGREPKYGLENDPNQISDILQMRGVDRALVAHFEAVYFDMYSGNEALLALVKNNPVLVPMAVINPWHINVKENYILELKNKGFVAVGFFPHYQAWTLNEYVVKKIAIQLNELGLPIQVGVSSLAELSLVVEIFRNVKAPILIRWLRGAGYLATADEIAIAVDHPNFYFDVSNLVSIDSIAYLANTIGAERLYLASNSPLLYEASAELLVEQSPISQTQKDLILGGTLSSIFNWPKNGNSIVAINRTVLLQKYQKIIDCPKIDVHGHTNGWDIIEPGTEWSVAKRVFDECNYQKIICSSIRALNFDLVRGNAEIAELVENDPRMFAYIVVDPMRVQESLTEIAKYSDNPRFIGLKTIQDYYPLGVDDERYQLFWEKAAELNYPVLCHRAGVITAAKKNPQVMFVVAHVTWERLQQLPELATLPNVMIDVSGSYAHRGETNLRAIIDSCGSDKILYSSDAPLISPYWALGKLLGTELTAEEQELIYTQNALRVFPRLA